MASLLATSGSLASGGGRAQAWMPFLWLSIPCPVLPWTRLSKVDGSLWHEGPGSKHLAS